MPKNVSPDCKTCDSFVDNNISNNSNNNSNINSNFWQRRRRRRHDKQQQEQQQIERDELRKGKKEEGMDDIFEDEELVIKSSSTKQDNDDNDDYDDDDKCTTATDASTSSSTSTSDNTTNNNSSSSSSRCSAFDADMNNILNNRSSSVHASLSYNYISNTGPPAPPLELPTPKVIRGYRTNVAAYDHRTGKLHIVKNVLIRRTNYDDNNNNNDRAYLLRKVHCKSIYGDIYLGVVFKRRPIGTRMTTANMSAVPVDSGGEIYNIDTLKDIDVDWISTEEMVAIKTSSWSKIRHLRGRHLEDPIKEIAALQLIGNYHPHCIGITDALQDDNYLYTVMPYCSNGDLYGQIFGDNDSNLFSSSGTTSRSCTNKSTDYQQYNYKNRQQRLVRPSSRSSVGSSSYLSFGEHSISTDITECGTRVDEKIARKIFRQLLSGLFHLQRKGLCHRDLSLENLLIDNEGLLKIIDLGMCLRVPYEDINNAGGCVTDVSAGTCRRLMVAQGQGGKLLYMAPEVVNRDDEFDGFAIDLWAAGVVLFIMVVGVAPFKWAHESDKRYANIAKGHLKQAVKELDNNIKLSNEVCDLLQNMLWRDPRKRLTLAQVMQHPWVLNKKSRSRSGAKQQQQQQFQKSAKQMNGYNRQERTSNQKNGKELLSTRKFGIVLTNKKKDASQ